MRALTPLNETSPHDPSTRPIASRLALVDVAVPDPGPGQVLIRVVAAGVNRADVAQSRGRYAPPTGTTVTLGLACAGIVASVGEGVARWHEGDAVCALVPGGACADMCLADQGVVMPLPLVELDPAEDPRYHPGFSGMSDQEVLEERLSRDTAPFVAAAILVEAAATTWLNLVDIAGVSTDPEQNSERVVLVHGGTGNVGSAAIQIARALGCRVLATAGSPERALACATLGAEAALDRHDDLAAFIKTQTGRRGADVILSVGGAGSFADDFKALATHGTLTVIGLLGGTYAELDLEWMLGHDLTIHAGTLRSQPLAVRSRICGSVETHVWPLVRRGLVRPVLAGVWALDQAGDAHAAVLHGGRIGAHALVP